jgi:hypothetical protein
MDQLLNLGWKFLLPISLGNLLLTTSFDDERKHRSNEEEEDYNLISPSCSLAKSDAIFFWRCLISYSRVVVGERLIRIRDDEFRDFR